MCSAFTVPAPVVHVTIVVLPWQSACLDIGKRQNEALIGNKSGTFKGDQNKERAGGVVVCELVPKWVVADQGGILGYLMWSLALQCMISLFT